MTLDWRLDTLLRQDSEDVFWTSVAESKLLLLDLADTDGKKGICQNNSYILGTWG